MLEEYGPRRIPETGWGQRPSREKAQRVRVSREGASVPRSLGGSRLLEGKAPERQFWVCHTLAVLWSNQAQYFGDGTRLSVLGKEQDQGGRAIVPAARGPCLSPQPSLSGVR